MKKLILFLFLAISCVAHGQDIPTNAGKYLAANTEQQKFSGAVLIAKNDEIIFDKAYGYADIADKKLNTINTEFRAGSLTKMFTSTLIMELIKENKLSLNDPVSRYIPNAKWADGITIKNLLSHTSGISGTTPANVTSLVALVEGFRADSSHFKPGSRFEYNNFNYLALSYIAQKITGTSFPALIKNKVFEPVGMLHSAIDSFKRTSDDKALGYTLDPNTNKWVNIGNDESVAAASGAGALVTTTADLFTWSKYVREKLKQGDSLFKQVTTPVLDNYGLGWINRLQDGHHMIGHTGSIPGFAAMLMIFPEENTTVIFLSNFQDMNTHDFVKNIISIAFNEPFEMPTVKKSIDLPEDVLQQYVGTYGQSAQDQLKFFIENKKLVVLAPGGDKVNLVAESKDNFYLEGPGIIIRFNRENGKVVSVFVSVGNQTLKKAQ